LSSDTIKETGIWVGRMLRIALISDIHANLHALDAVLAHARQYRIDTIWNLGDFVGYGAFPDSVVRRLRLQQVVSIVGNYDLKVLRFKKKKKKWRQSKHPDKFFAFGWAYKHLTAESREYLHGLPKKIEKTVDRAKILLTHGSPASINEPLFSSTPLIRFRALATLAGTDIILCGHSHEPFQREVDGVWFINPGSVGRPGDGDPRASYAILELDGQTVKVRHIRLSYDVDSAVRSQREQGLPENFSQMLLQGRSLDEV
jgi:putative phosphoesterase